MAKTRSSLSRIGKQAVVIPEGVTVETRDGHVVVRGPKGELSISVRPEVAVSVGEGKVSVSIRSDSREGRALHGLTRTLVSNLVRGVSEGFQKELEIQGVGYRAAMQGDKLVLQLGYSHPIEYSPPPGIQIQVEKNVVRISGPDREQVGQVAAEIRSFRPPEPYKGKGVRYQGEQVRRKAGKAGKAAA